MAERKNIIVIVCDTLRRDHVGCYGGTDVRTPNLDRFAAESVRFQDAFACSFPTLPCRVELFTGKFVFPSVRWGPYPAGETTLAEILAGAGYRTAMVVDNLPVARAGYGYDRGFETRIHIPGQWYDPWADADIDVRFPAPVDKLGQPERVQQYLRNVHDRRGEEDYFAPRVMSAASEWLEQFGSRGPFFLYVDCFDPHEPWDPPARDIDPAIVGDNRIIYPRMGRASHYSDAELRAIRELYAGEVRMVDRALGRVFEAVDRLALRGDTAIFFLSDHGMFLGEHNLLGKAGKRELDVNGWPPYREVSAIPLIMRVPELSPGVARGFVHPGDIMPTVLELAGVPVPSDVTASSLLPMTRGERLRSIAVTAWSYRGWQSHKPTCIRNEEWSMIWWRTGIPPRLHHLPSDPDEARDVYREHPKIARALHAEYVGFLKRLECAPRNYWSRRFLVSWAPAPIPADYAGAGA